ncbi:quinohemoprotein amine dehydrogenase maturation protein [Pukyongiella litopenaei]|uniref:Quinohemoprotein amine dehydrogenase maturation protein n=1 Tax=Pukyongiella litopenaei TaxID=2605946 RepID=A0A2S0MKC1_9RHOB|nr:quinohemoprotein amine dehydrogenase maturation protein [Pukyongiella litopenaei]AVO36320.1 quinohemoprotein amine dehydrogenase maturation protein [Pukyongiella litopenaei]
MKDFHFQPANAHRVAVDGREVLFHVPTTSLFDMDDIDRAVLDFAADHDAGFSRDDIDRRFGEAAASDAAARLDAFLRLDVVNDGRPLKPERPPIEIEAFPLTTIVLNVNTGCNLACSYCYKEDLAIPSRGQKMAFDTARRAVELLLRENPGRDSYNIVFFGGEPLSNLPLIRQVVDWAEPHFAALGSAVNFSLTTNATLLTEEIVDWLDRHRFGLTVSMDGPKAMHDLNRKTVGGKGTYDAVAKKARMLLARYRSKPVGVRVTLTAGVTRIHEIWDHLKNDIGFAEVGFSPVTSGEMDAFNLSGDELGEVFSGMKSLGALFLAEALEGRNIGFSNMHQLMQDLWEGRSKALPCGAGVGMLAVNHDGALNLCHRFVGSELDPFGSVETGIAREELAGFIKSRSDRTEKGCATCRIRNLCAGGCYHESYAHFSDPLKPAYHYCDLMRDWVDFGIGIYSRLIREAPEYFHTHISPRRAFGK